MGGISDALGQRTFKVKDNAGRDHELPSLTFGDARDLEKLIDCSLAECGDKLSGFDGQIKMLWGIVRREGLTRQQIHEARATGKWPISEEEVGDLFDLSQANQVFAQMTLALRAGGWEGQSDPTTPVAPGGESLAEMKTTPPQS